MTNIQKICANLSDRFDKQISTLIFDEGPEGVDILINNYEKSGTNKQLDSYILTHYDVEHLGNQTLWLHLINK